MRTEEILQERDKTHGEYLDHALASQQIKGIVRASRNYDKLNTHERETLEMIAHKIGRILAGDPHFCDHWDDIAGYAKLTADRNRKNV